MRGVRVAVASHREEIELRVGEQQVWTRILVEIPDGWQCCKRVGFGANERPRLMEGDRHGLEIRPGRDRDGSVVKYDEWQPGSKQLVEVGEMSLQGSLIDPKMPVTKVVLIAEMDVKRQAFDYHLMAFWNYWQPATVGQRS